MLWVSTIEYNVFFKLYISHFLYFVKTFVLQGLSGMSYPPIRFALPAVAIADRITEKVLCQSLPSSVGDYLIHATKETLAA